MTSTEADLYYDPYDFEIDADPYPVWRRLREERPLYYNERYDFFALFGKGSCAKRFAISSAAIAASAPLLPAFVPARSIACSIVSQVRTP